MPKHIGRRKAIGIGIEAANAQGTEVAATDWQRQMVATFQRRKTIITNDSGMGRIEKTNDSAVVARWADGDIGGKVYADMIGYFLYAWFGVVLTTTPSGETVVRKHDFSLAQVQNPPTLTISRKDPNSDRRHGLATVDKVEITWEQGGWVQFTATLRAKPGIAATSTPAYPTVSYGFTSKHIASKIANNLAGLSGATALATKSGRITLTREQQDPFIPNGTDTPTSFDLGSVTVDGELVLQYTDTTLEDLSYNNTVQSLQIAMANTDMPIGAASTPSLTFLVPRTRLNTFEVSDDLDSVVEQTVGFTGELDQVAGYLVSASLVNLKTLYV